MKSPRDLNGQTIKFVLEIYFPAFLRVDCNSKNWYEKWPQNAQKGLLGSEEVTEVQKGSLGPSSRVNGVIRLTGSSEFSSLKKPSQNPITKSFLFLKNLNFDHIYKNLKINQQKINYKNQKKSESR